MIYDIIYAAHAHDICIKGWVKVYLLQQVKKYFTHITSVFFVAVFLLNGMASLLPLFSIETVKQDIAELLTKTESENSGKEKDPPGNNNTICKILQPFIHSKPCYRGSNHQRNQHQFYKFDGQKIYYPWYISSQYFSYTNFFCTLHGTIGWKAKQTETGNKNGEYSKIEKEITEMIFSPVLPVKKFI